MPLDYLCRLVAVLTLLKIVLKPGYRTSPFIHINMVYLYIYNITSACIVILVSDWWILDCFTSSGKCYVHIQNVNTVTLNTIERSCSFRSSGTKVSEKWTDIINHGILDIDRSFALHYTAYSSHKEMLQWFAWHFILTGRGWDVVHVL